MRIYIFKLKRTVIIISIILLICLLACTIVFATQSKASKQDENIFEKQNQINKLFNSKEKIAYLTFDDGPTKKVTPKVLDILEKTEVKATFFVVGKHVLENPDIVKRAYDNGHYIANHGYSHDNSKLYISNETFLKEIQDTDAEIAKAIGKSSYCSYLFRFPNGFIAKMYKSQKTEALKVLEANNYSYIDWNSLTKDSEKKYSNSALLRNLKQSAKNKGTLVILMHDTGDVNNTYDVLEDCIMYLKEEGYIFKNFYDIFPEQNCQ